MAFWNDHHRDEGFEFAVLEYHHLLLQELKKMAETQQQQHDAIMASLNTAVTNLTTINTTGVDLLAEVQALKTANPGVDFTDAETLASQIVTQSAATIAAVPDPGAPPTPPAA